MIITTLSIILLLIFTFLSLIHVYWVFGGKWGIAQAIPTKEDGSLNLNPPPIATIIVAAGLMVFALFYLLKSGLIQLEITGWIFTIGYWFIPVIFIIRAIGDFNYVGIFKKIKHSTFGKADSKIFIPLCLSIGVMGIVIQLLNYG
jgi:hypothetical protein